MGKHPHSSRLRGHSELYISIGTVFNNFFQGAKTLFLSEAIFCYSSAFVLTPHRRDYWYFWIVLAKHKKRTIGYRMFYNIIIRLRRCVAFTRVGYIGFTTHYSLPDYSFSQCVKNYLKVGNNSMIFEVLWISCSIAPRVRKSLRFLKKELAFRFFRFKKKFF